MPDPATIMPGLAAALVLGIAVVADQRSAKRVRPRPVLFPTIFVDLVRQTAVSHAWQNPPSTGFVPPRTGHADSLGSQRRGRRRGSALTQHAIGNRREPTRYNGQTGQPPKTGVHWLFQDPHQRRDLRLLPHVKPGDGPTDDHALDLGCALENGEVRGGTGGFRS